MKYLIYLSILILINSFSIVFAQEITGKKENVIKTEHNKTDAEEDLLDKIIIKDNDSHSLIEINDEGDNGGSITLPDATSVTSTTNKLYNIGGTLNWNGSALSTSGSSLWNLNGSDIYYNTGNVGIGLTTPPYIFTVYTENDVGALFQNSTTGTSISDGFWIGYYNNMAYLVNLENTQLRIGTNNSTKMMIAEDGNVGIGTTNPSVKLDVAGRIGIDSHIMLNLPNQTDFVGTMFFGGGNAGYNLSHTVEHEGQYNTAVGFEALFDNTTGHSNTVMGYWAGRANTIGHDNTFTGWGSGQGNLSGSGNCFYGNASGMWNTGNNNVYLGSGAGNSGGNNNIFIGSLAGQWHTEGSNNVIIGYFAGSNGSNPSTNEGCVFIGNRAAQFETGNNKLYIENSESSTPLIGGDFSTDDVIINGNLKVTGTLKDKDGEAGSAGQILSSTSTGTDWIASPSGADNLGNHTATQDIDIAGFEVNLNGGYLSGDGDEEGVYVTSDGKVGIGTASPGSALEVQGKVYVNSATDAEVTIGSTDNSYRGIFTAKNKGPNNYIQLGIGGLSYSEPHFGLTLSNWGYIYGNNISGLAIGTLDGAELIFGTNNTEKMRLDNTGNFGVGTASPSAKLEVKGSGTAAISSTTGDFWVTGPDETAERIGLSFNNSNDEATINVYAGARTKLYFENTAVTREIDVIFNDGNVGIGTSTPNEKLEVEGKVRTNTGFNVNGADGVTGTFNFYHGDVSGNVSSITINGGIITDVVTVPE